MAPYRQMVAASGDLAQVEKIARADRKFMEMVQATYCGQYWSAAHCQELPGILAYPVFSASVNCGHVTAIRLLQRALGIKDDGVFGDITRHAIHNTDSHILVNAFCEQWKRYYRKIVLADSSQAIYLKGWLNRIENVKKDNY